MLDRATLISEGMVSNKTNAVYDAKFWHLFKTIPWQDWFSGDGDPLYCRKQYIDTYQWYLGNMKLNKISGLDRFKQRHLINGTTQTFDEAYHRYSHRRLRIYRGEYAYHKRVVPGFVYIEDEPIRRGDYVIVSVPHCTTGDVPVGFYDMLDACAAVSVPVIVDCAYIGTSVDVNFSVDHKAIESVSFSLTKGTGTGHIRSGVRYSDIEDDMPIAQQNHWNHTVLGAAKVGIWFMENLETPDFIADRYRESQLTACADAGLVPTKCMHVAIGGDEWGDFNVDGYNRVGIRNLVKARKNGSI